MPECGFSLARIDGFALDREMTRRDDGDRTLVLVQTQPPPNAAGHAAMFDHPLDASALKPVGTRITVGCAEVQTSWDPRRFAERYIQRRVAISVSMATAPNGTPMGLSDGVTPPRPNRGAQFFSYAVWQAAPDLWATVYVQLNMDSPHYEPGRVRVWPCDDVRGGAQTEAACLAAVREANDLPSGQKIWLPRNRRLNEAWARDVFATLRPLRDGPQGLGD